MPVAISLGWNCWSAMWGVHNGYREMRSNGYKTCPFDMMVTNYDGMVRCIGNKLADLTDPEQLSIVKIPLYSIHNPGQNLIFQNKYKFWFNHESPGHADLYIKEGWAGGINHYVDNNYALLRERYDYRVSNFLSYVNSGERITFIITLPPDHKTTELNDVLSQTFPDLSFEILQIDLENSQATPRAAFYSQKELMNAF